MLTLKTAFDLPVGYSDHSIGVSVPVAAAAMGAKVIEKHFTLDKKRPGPDHKASLEPHELKTMIQYIRETERALGTPVKRLTSSDLENLGVARKSIVATGGIRKGERFSADNIDIMRPGTGLSPMNYWSLLGQVAPRDFEAGDVVTL